MAANGNPHVRRIRWWSAAVVITCAWPAWAVDPAARIGAHGWIVEEFGSDVAVLRAPVSPEPRGEGEVGALLSCSGPDRRIRLSFPTPLAPPPRTAEVGSTLITPLGASKAGGAVAARFALSNSLTITVSEVASPSRDIGLMLGRMLMARPRELDLLMSIGPKAVTFGHLTFLRLIVTLSAGDAVSVGRFVAACQRAPVRRMDGGGGDRADDARN